MSYVCRMKQNLRKKFIDANFIWISGNRIFELPRVSAKRGVLRVGGLNLG